MSKAGPLMKASYKASTKAAATPWNMRSMRTMLRMMPAYAMGGFAAPPLRGPPAKKHTAKVRIPEGVAAGEYFAVTVSGRTHNLQCPVGKKPGDFMFLGQAADSRGVKRWQSADA